MKYFHILSLIAFIFSASAQNLVPDPGFENWNGTAGFFMAPLYDWDNGNPTPDHHHQSNPPGNNLTSATPSIPLTNSGNTAAGAVYAGLGCVGIYKANNAGNSEWASTLLTSPLQKDSCYEISFYIQNKKNQAAFPMATNNWGVYFGFNAVTNNPQNITYGTSSSRWANWPQVINDTTWHHVVMNITPDSNYTHLSLGYVGDWVNANYISFSTQGTVGFYVWIDEVSVVKIPGCCPSTITSVVPTNETCSLNNGSIVVNSTATAGTYTLYNTFTGALMATNGTGNFTGLNVGTYYAIVNDGTCSKTTQNYTLIDTGTFPNAGNNGNTTVCSNGSTFNLFSTLSGGPNSGGVWSPPLASGTNFFNPAIDTSGIYTYSVTNICGTDSSTATVIVTPAPDATIAAAGPFCAGSAPVNLVAGATGGVWSGNEITSATNGTFDPTNLTPGLSLISYTITGACSNMDTILLTVLANDNAGFSYAVSNYCNSGLSGTPTVTGTPGGTFTMNPAGTIDAATGVVDLGASGAGNYMVIYTTNGVCPKADSVAIQISGQLSVNVTPAGPLCVDASSIALVADIPAGVWSGNGVNATTGLFNPASAGVGTWQIVYTVAGLCGDSDTIQIVVNPLPNADAGPDQIFQEDSLAILTATGGLSYVWVPSTGLGCDSCATTTAQPIQSYTYTVQVTDINGCVAYDNMTLTIKKITGSLYIPNAFTPDGDEHNNTLRTTGFSVKFFHMEIFDRWGGLVFVSDDINSHWDGTFGGKPCPQGIYTYSIRYGLNFDTDEVLRLTGHVNVLR
jgi:gliding motility-associated-like protein